MVFVAAGVAAPIVAHAFDSTPTPKVEMVGKPAVFSSAASAAPATPLPSGAQNGDFLVSYVEAPPTSAIGCGYGWIKRLDVVNGTATRLVVCTRLKAEGDAQARATVAPAAHVSMATMAFSDVDLVTPVGPAAGSMGLLGPSVKTAIPNSMVVLGEGGPHWRFTFTPPAGATGVASTSDRAASQLVSAIQPIGPAGTVPAARWSRTGGAYANGASSSSDATTDKSSGVYDPSGPESITAAIVLNPATEPVTTTTTMPPTTTTTQSPPPDGGAPTSPPAEICGNHSILDGPSSPPAGAVTLTAGNNGDTSWTPNTTYWLAPGVHTVGTDMYSQIIPADGDTFVGAPGAILDGQGKNNYAFTQHASGVTVSHLTIRNFMAPHDQGVVNHDSGNGWTITNNTMVNNGGAAMMAGANQVVRDNCLANNGQYAMNAAQAGDGVTNLVVDHNEISGNNTGDWEKVDPGCGCAGGMKLWAVRGATITDNYVHDNRGPAVWADTDNVGIDIEGNYISDNDGEAVIYETSYNGYIHDNTMIRNALVAGPTNPGFPVGAIYISESGGDARVSPRYSTFEISGNVLIDNWSGVVLWENADRFCNSPANSSTGYCTEGGKASLSTCVAGTIAHEPYLSDCRWKTQNVSVHDNTFSLDASKLHGCSASTACGLNGVFSQWGTVPSWSPYKEQTVEDAITFHQNNEFANNSYTGPWFVMAHDQATILSMAQWEAAPYHQDGGSRLH